MVAMNMTSHVPDINTLGMLLKILKKYDRIVYRNSYSLENPNGGESFLSSHHLFFDSFTMCFVQ